ncbi:hypothetical protein HYV81_02690 [Candidatus Woesearchaeota archaeon]|nr:hypothetical protein [Candidatus Woesearchaeota archaeon]
MSQAVAAAAAADTNFFIFSYFLLDFGIRYLSKVHPIIGMDNSFGDSKCLVTDYMSGMKYARSPPSPEELLEADNLNPRELQKNLSAHHPEISSILF